VLEVARRRCGGRVVSSLEGGYDLEALGRSAVAHARALSAA
jgi:acetoin utilization deacetylase AcuC-like enzyme